MRKAVKAVASLLLKFIIGYVAVMFFFMWYIEYDCYEYVQKEAKNKDSVHQNEAEETLSKYDTIWNASIGVRLFAYALWPMFLVSVVKNLIAIIFGQGGD